MSSTINSIKKVVLRTEDEDVTLVDLTVTDAQVGDVASGKKFFGADGALKMGTGEGIAGDAVLGTLRVTSTGEYDASNYPDVDGWSHVSATLSTNNQTKSVTMDKSQASKTVTPDSGYTGLDKVTVSVSSTTKTVTPTSSSQTVSDNSNRYLTSVTVNPVPTDSVPTITPSGSAQTKTAVNWYKLVKVAAVPTETKSQIVPSNVVQTVTASSGKWFNSLSVAAVPTETKTVTPTEAAQTVTASSNKWFKTITVDKINVATTPTITENKTLTAPDGQYYKEVIVNVEGTGGTDTSDATATAADILVGKSAYIASGKVDGTIPKYDRTFTGGVEITTTTVSDGKPIELDTASEMDSALASASFGQVFRYVGYDCQYENGALYRVSGVKRI